MKRIAHLSPLLLLLVACSAATKHKVLSVLFDGVPEAPPEEVVAEPVELSVTPDFATPAPQPDPIADLAAADLAAGGFEAIDALPLRPVPRITREDWQPAGVALEEAKTWEEALRILPTDIAGGVDWVAAVEQRLSLPQLVLDTGAGAPFTLDTLLGGGVSPGSPFLEFNVQMTPEENPFFEVTFPHASHTLFLACSSCHPGVQEWDVPMDQILAGEACGQCHGRVSFDPRTGCARCHENLVPPEEELVAAELTEARQQPVPASPELRERGAVLYRRYCAFCHGETGDGEGRFVPWLSTKPRNFVSGTYKFRSSFGPLPTDLDLFRTITRGIPGTSMPAWSALQSDDRWALVHYIKTFSDLFNEEEPGEPLSIPAPPAATAELLEEGKELFSGAGCDACHGEKGRGDGPSAKSLSDNWGQPIRPYNFASGRPMKSGSGTEAIFRVVMTGIGGTPMPGFGESLSEQQVWALARYVETFRGQARAPFAVKGDIRFQRGGMTNGGAAPPGGQPAVAASGESDGEGFWGDEAAGDSSDGESFWGDEVDEIAADGGGESFWGDEVDEIAADGGGESFWGNEVDEVAADGGGEGFWGDEVDEVAADGGGESFWGDEVAGDSSDGESFWDEEAGDPAAESFARAAAEDFPAAEPEVPPAIFPHWFHRVRFKCANCHPRVFEMRAGANPINMDAMRAGLYCAKCHNGKIAWQITFTTCPRCHQAAQP